MNRRIRKKKRVGEFRELGFELTATLAATDDEAHERFLDRAIDCAEPLGLTLGGGGSGAAISFFVTKSRRGSVSAEERDRFARAVADDIAVRESRCGPLVDAWHGPFGHTE